ncbi:MAG: Fic family protein [Solimonas sp.]
MLPLSRLSPYRIEAPALCEKEQELARRAGRLERALHPQAAPMLARAMAGIHSYYSNQIEGYGTEPIEAERALAIEQAAAQGLAAEPSAKPHRHLQQALAGIHAAYAMREQIAAGAVIETGAFVRFLHLELLKRIPEEQRYVEGENGLRAPVVPGEYRTGLVKVGLHVPPPAAEVPALVDALDEVVRLNGRVLTIILQLHHRLAWVHPFYDGNGRVARLFTEAMLLRSPAAGAGLWSLSRGLARNATRYRDTLALADKESRGSDGRGPLSETATVRFVDFMLDTALDQVSFMDERLDPDALKDRVDQLCIERAQVMERDPRAAALLKAAMFSGPQERGRVGEIVGLSARRGQSITQECLADGLLHSPSERGLLYPKFPMYALAYLFPSLYPLDDPRREMRDYLRSGVAALTVGERLVG